MMRIWRIGENVKSPLPAGFLFGLLLSAPALADPAEHIVSFSVQPELGVRARYIERINFRICQIRSRDPWDDRTCEGWHSFQNGSRLSFRGRLCIIAEWDDHRRYRGSVEMSPTGANFAQKIEPREDKGTCT